MADAHVLYPFRFRGPTTGKWTRARYRASLSDIAERHADWELIGEPEYWTGDGHMFSPFRRLGSAEVEVEPLLRPSEAPLAVFLRRYVTWGAGTRRFAAMQGASCLLRAIGQP